MDRLINGSDTIPCSTGMENIGLSLISQSVFQVVDQNNQAIGNSPSISKNIAEFIKRDVGSGYENDLQFYLLVEQQCPFFVCISGVEVEKLCSPADTMRFQLGQAISELGPGT